MATDTRGRHKKLTRKTPVVQVRGHTKEYDGEQVTVTCARCAAEFTYLYFVGRRATFCPACVAMTDAEKNRERQQRWRDRQRARRE